MEINGQQVILELAPRFAPKHAANIRTLAREGYYTGSAVVRVQDNYVTQWADPADEEKEKDKVKPLGTALASLPAALSVLRTLSLTPRICSSSLARSSALMGDMCDASVVPSAYDKDHFNSPSHAQGSLLLPPVDDMVPSFPSL